MTPQDHLIRAIKATKRTIAEANTVLAQFNDPEWPDQIFHILRVADELRQMHEVQPDVGVADDYSNLSAILAQIIWPEDEDIDAPDDEYRENDRRLTLLRNWMGGLQADIVKILTAAAAMGIRAHDAGLVQLVAKTGRADELSAIETGFVELSQELALLGEAGKQGDGRLVVLTQYFQTRIQINIDVSQLALQVGSLIDLAIFKRVGSAITQQMRQFSQTINAAASRAGTAMKARAESFRRRTMKLIGAAGRLVRQARIEIETLPLPDDYAEQARAMILAGTTPPAHWVPHLTDLDFGGSELVDFAPLSNLTSLQILGLGDTQVSGIGAMSNLTALWSLDLRDTQVSDIGALSNLTALQILGLSRTQVSDIGALSNLTALRSLDLRKTQVSDISALTKLTALQSLVLSGTQVSDIGALSKLTALKNLYLSDVRVSDVSALTKLTALQRLVLWSTQVSDIGALTNLTALEDLDLMDTPVSDIGALTNLTALKSLDLRGTQVSDIGALMNLTTLESLDLMGTPVSDIGALTNLTALKSLNLMGTQVSDLAPLSDHSGLEIKVSEVEVERLRATLRLGSTVTITAR